MVFVPCADFFCLYASCFVFQPRVLFPAHFFQCAPIAWVASLHAQRFSDAPQSVSDARCQDNGCYDILNCHHVICCLSCKITNKILVLQFIVPNFAPAFMVRP